MIRNSVNTCNGTNDYSGGHTATDIIKSLFGLPEALFRTLSVWQKRAQDRRHLKALETHFLKDMGLTREEVVHETSKPFWRS